MNSTIEASISTKLKALAKKHPDIKKLISIIPDDLTITIDWMEAFNRHPERIRFTVRNLLLGGLKSGEESREEERFYSVRRLQYFLYNNRLPIASIGDGPTAKKDDVPNICASSSGLSRHSYYEFILKYAIYVRAKSRDDTDITSLADQIINHYLLTSDKIQRFLQSKDSIFQMRYFFPEASKGICFINTLTFMRDYIPKMKEYKKIQDKFPRGALDTLGRERSTPDMLAMTDIMCMKILGLTSYNPEALRGLLSRHDELPNYRLELTRLARQVSQYYFLTADKKPIGVAGHHGTGFLFNTERICRKSRSKGEVQNVRKGYIDKNLASGYQKTDVESLKRFLLDSHAASGMALDAIFKQHKEEIRNHPMAARDYANIAAYGRYMIDTGEYSNDENDVNHYSKRLPYPARYRLGVPEPSQATKKTTRTHKRKKSDANANSTKGKQIEEFELLLRDYQQQDSHKSFDQYWSKTKEELGLHETEKTIAYRFWLAGKEQTRK